MEKRVLEIKIILERADLNGLDMWCWWAKRGYLRMLHTKMEETQPRGWPRTRWIAQIKEGIEMGMKIARNTGNKEVGEQTTGFLCNSRPITSETI